MRDVLNELMAWWHAGDAVGVGTVVATFRSAPRPAGASMLVGPDDSAVGSVSGGCVEGAVYDLGTAVRDGAPPVLERYGVSDDDAFAVGLTCGGIIDIFVQQVVPATWPDLPEIAADVAAGRPVVVAQVVEHPDADMVGTRVVVRPGDDVPPSPGPVAGAEDGAEDRDPAHVAALERERLLAEREAAGARVDSARMQLAAAERRLELARESRGFFEKSFRLGETDLPTRLRIEAEAAEAERQAARARVELAAAISALRQILGLLPQ